MGQPAAKQGDRVIGTCTHQVIVPGTPPQQPILPHPFAGILRRELSRNVSIMGKPAATIESVAENMPKHVPTPPGTNFVAVPNNQAVVKTGSATVRINGRGAARSGDRAATCTEAGDKRVGVIVATGSVAIGG